MEEIQNGTFTTVSCDVFSLVTITLQHSWLLEILLVIFLRNAGLDFSKVDKLCRSITQAPQQCDYGWQGMQKNMQVSRKLVTSSGLGFHS